MRAALRQFSIILGSLVFGTALVSILLGLALGSTLSRSLSLGWYIVGSLFLIGGFFVGNRGPARPEGHGWGPFSLRRWVRWATPVEQRESISLSALLVIVGFILVALGVVADSRSHIV